MQLFLLYAVQCTCHVFLATVSLNFQRLGRILNGNVTILFLLHPQIVLWRSDSSSESTTESEEQSEVSQERLGRLLFSKLCNCYHVSVSKSVLLDSLVQSGTNIISSVCLMPSLKTSCR